MILAKVSFGPQNGPKDQCEDAAEGYLAALFHSGQLCGEYFVTWTNGVLNAHALLAGPNAHHTRHHSEHGKKELKKAAALFKQQPAWTMLDDEAKKPAVSWKGAPFLFLQTHAFEWDSPVCRGDGKGRIPTYKLPITFAQKNELYSWQRGYYYHDHIWLGSGALEIPAYRQLADPESELSQEGRALSRILEDATGLPTFYYLMRYYGRKRGESQRQCPGCGGSWQLNNQEKGHFWNFDFKCDKCRLAAHEASSPEGGRYVKIGEFKPRRSR